MTACTCILRLGQAGVEVIDPFCSAADIHERDPWGEAQ